MKFHILTLFPEMVLSGLRTSIIGRAMQSGLIELNAVNMRDYTLDKHGKVDDYPYGGGAGMLIQAQPVYDAYRSVAGEKRMRTVYVTPQGKPFTQDMAEEFSKEEELVFLCGHYEGIDERVLQELVTDYVSIGDYVLTGGELPAMVMIDAVSRLVPGVLNNEVSAETESFHNDLLEYPQYSRPAIWHGREVPPVLLSGDHRRIMQWRLAQSEERTQRVRPDLYARYQRKQKLIKRLSRNKRSNIHMMELLKRGNGQIVYEQGDSILLYDKKGRVYVMTAPDAEAGRSLVERIPEGAGLFVANKPFFEALLKERFAVAEERICVQACYTQREAAKVTYPQIRRLGGEALFAISSRYRLEEDSYLLSRLEEGAMYGAFCEERLVGFIGLHEDGSMGMLYVEEEFRRQGIGASLEGYLINRQLEAGLIPYCHVLTENRESIRLQERLGLYLSDERIYWFFA